MPRWKLEFEPRADADLAELDKPVCVRVIEKLDWLLENFDLIFHSNLHHQWNDFYKLRVGDFRVIYRINWQKSILIVCYIDRRDKVYKKK